MTHYKQRHTKKGKKENYYYYYYVLLLLALKIINYTFLF